MLFRWMCGGTKKFTYENELASERDVWMNFRRDFTLDEVPQSAPIKIACDSKYWMWINGELVVFEGQLKRGPTKDGSYYETLDIAEYLKQGKNTLAIQVWYWGTGGFNTNVSGSGGLIFSSNLMDASTDKTVETGDGSWWALRDPAYRKGERAMMRTEPSTIYDARNEINGWMNPSYNPAVSEDGWNLAASIGTDTEDPGYVGDGPWNELWERPIPQWKDYGLTLCDYSVEGNTYTIKLPYNCQFTPYLKLGDNTEDGVKITITTDTQSKYGSLNTYTTKAGAQEYEAKNWINGDYLYFEIPEEVEVKALGFHETGYPVESGENTDFLGYFDSVVDYSDPSLSQFTGGHTWTENEADADNNFYDEIWKKSVRTLYVTIRDTYMDCPDRERSQYIGDAINELEEAFYSLGTSVNPLSAKAVKNICDWQIETEIDGRTYYLMSNVRPGGNAQEISCQSLGTALAASKYYLFTGDSELPQYCYQKLYNYLTNYDMVTEGEEAGLVANRSSRYHMYDSNLWQWFDWGNNQDTRLETNLWWYISALSVREMADVEGVPATEEQKAWLDERLASIEENFEKFWNEDLQAYATQWNKEDWYSTAELENGSHLVDDRANALAVVYGLVPEEKYPLMRDVFIGTETAPAYENASIYMEKYVIEALYKMGYDEEAMQRITKRHINEVNDATSSTMPEYWYKNGKGTKNHGWSGGSMIALSRYATGVVPTEAGYGEGRLPLEWGLARLRAVGQVMQEKRISVPLKRRAGIMPF